VLAIDRKIEKLHGLARQSICQTGDPSLGADADTLDYGIIHANTNGGVRSVAVNAAV